MRLRDILRVLWRAGLVLVILCICSVASARFRQPNEEYRLRRDVLAVTVDEPIVIFGYTGHEDSSEVALFFQEPNFYYLTGHDEPGAALVIYPRRPQPGESGIVDYLTPTAVLYLPARDPKEEVWEGPKIGPDDPDVAAKTGFANVEPIANLRGDLEKLAKTYKNFYTLLPPKHEEGYPHLTNSVAEIRSAIPHATLKDITPQLDAMRQVKSAGELALMQKAIDASIDAHLEAMKLMRPGLYRISGGRENGGDSRVRPAARPRPTRRSSGRASTPRSCTTTSSTARSKTATSCCWMSPGSIRRLRGGHHAHDSRERKIHARQREIYEIVLGAQNAALAALKPGMTLTVPASTSLQKIAMEYIDSHGKDKEGPLARPILHSRPEPSPRTRRARSQRPPHPLEPGMVITIEPGIYIPEENLGVRIEDDVLITPTVTNC